MKVSFTMKSMLIAALLGGVTLAGCSKDDSVNPCSAHPDETGAGAKVIGGEALEVDQAIRGRGPLKEEDPSPGISDDGDDVGDGERNKKKKPNG